MPVKRLPAHPNLEHLKYQAKDLVKGQAAHNAGVAHRIREFHPQFAGATDEAIFAAKLSLSAAQRTIAREYGFPSWARLKAHVESPALASKLKLPHHERVEDVRFRHAVDLIDAGDATALRAWLRQHPDLVRQRVVFEGGNYFRNPSLLEFIAENPIRRGRMPDNVVEIARVILDAGPERSSLDETLMLVTTGLVPRECGAQVALIDLLCERDAKPDGAMRAAVAHGEFGAAEALIACGATIDLPVAAALGREADFRKLLPSSDEDDRHRAMAMATQFGHVEIVRALLDAGLDQNRYNPPDAHSHSTPLHQAAAGGHVAVVRLLLERGARTDIKDLLWQGTAADWAHHEKKAEVEALLCEWEANRKNEQANR